MPNKKQSREARNLLHSTRHALDKLDDHLKKRKKPSYGKLLAGSILALSAAASTSKLRDPKTRKATQAKLDKLSMKLRKDVKEIQQRFVKEHPEMIEELKGLRDGIEKRLSDSISEAQKTAKKSVRITKKTARKATMQAKRNAKKTVKKVVRTAKKKVAAKKKAPSKKKVLPKRKTVKKKAVKRAVPKKKVVKKNPGKQKK